jgi:acetyl-CoA carboxylase biotin carboxyl carrier protein
VTESRPPAPAWLGTVRSIVALLETSDVRELEWRTPGLRIALRRAYSGGSLPAGGPAETEDVEDAGGLHLVRSPLTGIWYDSPAPDATPFVQVGDAIDVGSVLGLVETMKVFNEVTSDAAGIVRQVLVRRGDLIASHAPLVAIEPQAPLFPVDVGTAL